jgi:hypothetical protein
MRAIGLAEANKIIDGIHAGGFRGDLDFDARRAKQLNIKVDPPLRDPRNKS